MSYATIANLRAYLGQIAAGAGNDALLQSVLDRATAIVDTELGFQFGTAVAGTAVAYGDGTDYLHPPFFVTGSVTLVTAPSGYTVPTYVEQDGYLVVARGGRIGVSRYGYHRAYGDSTYGYYDYPSSGWWPGLPYTVAATFGFALVPADIVEACLEIAVDLWRFKDSGSIKALGVEGAGMVTGKGLPATAQRILDHYRLNHTPGVY